MYWEEEGKKTSNDLVMVGGIGRKEGRKESKREECRGSFSGTLRAVGSKNAELSSRREIKEIKEIAILTLNQVQSSRLWELLKKKKKKKSF